MSIRVLLLLVVISGSVSAGPTTADFSRLYHDLFGQENDYTEFPPVQANFTVSFGIEALCLDLDMDNVLNGRIWYQMTWNDERYAWDPEEYSGIKTVRVDPSRIFVPDIYQYNRYEADEIMHPERVKGVRSRAVIVSDGTVIFVPDIKLKVFCSDNSDKDDLWAEQRCHMRFGSWTFDGDVLDLAFYGDTKGVQMSSYDEGCPVKILSTSGEYVRKYYDCCPEPYPYLDFNVTVQRKYIATERGIMYNPKIKDVKKEADANGEHSSEEKGKE